MTLFQTAACAAAALCMVAGESRADILQLVSTLDNTLYQTADGSLSNGSGPTMFAGRNNTASNSIRRALVEFDVSTIPAGAVLTSATLRLNMSQTSGPAAFVTASRVLGAWGEGSSNAGAGGGGGAPSQPGDATWLHTFFNTTPWTLPGGDFAPVPSASLSVAGIGSYSWSSPGILADVQAWIATPTDNHGWGLVGNEASASTAKRFDTREATLPDNRPTLIVEYTVPTPASGVIGVLGLCMTARPRRV